MGFASNLVRSLVLSLVFAVAFSFPMVLHALEEDFRVVHVPDELEQLLRVAVSFVYPLAAFKLGQGAASRSRATISGFTLGVARASVETIAHPYYLIDSGAFMGDALMAIQLYVPSEPLEAVSGFLLRNLNYILLGTFISSLGGLHRYLDRLSKPLRRKSLAGNRVHFFRDYWSNRYMFDKNKFPESPSLDLSTGDKPHSVSPELFLRRQGQYVEAVDAYSNRILASDLQDPENLAARFEPVWNPIPVAVEKKITRWVMPLSVFLSVLSVFLSARNIFPIVGSLTRYLQFVSLRDLLFFVANWGSVLLSTVFPVLLVFILTSVLIVKVRHLRDMKPESSLTLLFLTILMPILTYGVSKVALAQMTGDLGTAKIWLPILSGSLAILFASSLRIRDFENVSIYLYQTAWNDMEPLWYQQDKPVWAKADFYWVLRYMYFWPIEMTVPFPHTDWERVEVWVNARTAQPEWIATDYHYRELWYEVVGYIPRIFIDFDPNFHTPLPLTFSDELDYMQQVLFQRLSILSHISSQVRYIRKGRWYNLWVGTSFESQLRATLRQMHPEEALTQITGSKMLASRLASLHWKNWRYAQGADRKDLYSAVAKNYAATLMAQY